MRKYTTSGHAHLSFVRGRPCCRRLPELSSKKVPKLSRRYNRLKKKINTMALPPPDVWTCPDCSYSENIDCATCNMCQTARPRGSRSFLLVDKKSTHPAAVAARRGCPPSTATKQARSARSTALVAPRESPSRGAKDTANQRIAAQLGVVAMAEVVHSPVSSPDGPLVPPPAVARADTGAGVGLGDDEDSSSDDDSPRHGVGHKTTGLDASSPPAFDYGLDNDGEDDFPTDGEVSKYSFHQRLIHYMDGALIDQQNRKAVELAILVEAGTKVRDMDPMKKATREQVLHRKYLEIINELEDNCFEDTAIRTDMTTMFKGGKARQGLSGSNLLRKLEREMTEVRKFAVKFPGFNNPAGLPSGLIQLRDMKAPVVAKLWKTKYPVMSFLIVTSLFCSLLSLR
jgi:hypothetical protein